MLNQKKILIHLYLFHLKVDPSLEERQTNKNIQAWKFYRAYSNLSMFYLINFKPLQRYLLYLAAHGSIKVPEGQILLNQGLK